MRSISWQTAGHDNSLLRRRVVFALIAIVIQLAKVSWGQAVPQEPEGREKSFCHLAAHRFFSPILWESCLIVNGAQVIH